jgi:hypothetical protein
MIGFNMGLKANDEWLESLLPWSHPPRTRDDKVPREWNMFLKQSEQNLKC